MRVARLFVLVSLALAMAASCAQAKVLQDYIDQVQRALSERNVHTMLDITRVLKGIGASYQQSLTAPLDDAATAVPGEHLKMMVGVYQFDALYAAAFRKKKQASDALAAQSLLMDKMNLRGRLDVTAVFPPEIRDMMRDPETMSVGKVIDAYAKNAKNYEKMMREPQGFDLLESALYGFVVEGLYVVTQTAGATGDDQETARMLTEPVTLAGTPPSRVSLLETMQTGTRLILQVYLAFDDKKMYGEIVDPERPEEMVERRSYMAEVLDILKEMQDGVSTQSLTRLTSMVNSERAKILRAN